MINGEINSNFNKSFEFEDHSFKIDSTGRQEEERPIFSMRENGNKMVRIKVNSTNDVVEFLEGPAKGEQLFITYDAFMREVCKAKNCSPEEAKQKYLLDADEIKAKMENIEEHTPEYFEFFEREIRPFVAGHRSNRKGFRRVDGRYEMRLSDGTHAKFNSVSWYVTTNSKYFGFSIRLLKN